MVSKHISRLCIHLHKQYPPEHKFHEGKGFFFLFCSPLCPAGTSKTFVEGVRGMSSSHWCHAHASVNEGVLHLCSQAPIYAQEKLSEEKRETKELDRTSLAVQWLRLHASIAGGTVSIPVGELRSLVPRQKKKKKEEVDRRLGLKAWKAGLNLGLLVNHSESNRLTEAVEASGCSQSSRAEGPAPEFWGKKFYFIYKGKRREFLLKK